MKQFKETRKAKFLSGLQRMLEDKRKIQECIEAGRDLRTLASDGIRFIQPL